MATSRSRAMAWSLTYYLANQRRANLLRYLQDLAAQPRDLELDDDLLLLTFGRAFDLVDPSKPVSVKPVEVLVPICANVVQLEPWQRSFQHTPAAPRDGYGLNEAITLRNVLRERSENCGVALAVAGVVQEPIVQQDVLEPQLRPISVAADDSVKMTLGST